MSIGMLLVIFIRDECLLISHGALINFNRLLTKMANSQASTTIEQRAVMKFLK